MKIIGYFQEYTNNTSIHGCKYVGERHRSFFERTMWVIIFLICLFGCGSMIYKIYVKWETSPVIVTFATKETPIYEIPFPAVTICPESKFMADVFNFTKILHMKLDQQALTTNESRHFDFLSQVCDGHRNSPKSSLPSNETANITDADYFNEGFFDFLDEVQPNLLEYNNECFFGGYEMECSALFNKIITDEGICYSFNMMDRDEIFRDAVFHHKNFNQMRVDFFDNNDSNNSTGGSWSLERGYKQILETYPIRAALSGAPNGLVIYLVTEKKNLDYSCKDLQGYKVLLHTPVRVPRLKHDFFRVPLDQAVIAAIKPEMIRNSDSVKNYEPKKRNCYFPTEKKLKYFKEYSQLNCQLECLTDFTFKECQCVSFFMPRFKNTSICGTRHDHCVKEAETILQEDEVINKFAKHSSGSLESCDCLPVCSDLSYHSEISQSDFPWKAKYKALRLNTTLGTRPEDLHLSMLTIYFRTNHFITSERHELYGPTDFLANFGGLLGLFTGFSILSFIEIIYFLLVRWCCNIKIYGNWFGEKKP